MSIQQEKKQKNGSVKTVDKELFVQGKTISAARNTEGCYTAFRADSERLPDFPAIGQTTLFWLHSLELYTDQITPDLLMRAFVCVKR